MSSRNNAILLCACTVLKVGAHKWVLSKLVSRQSLNPTTTKAYLPKLEGKDSELT